MKAIFGILFGFGVTLAVTIGGRMGADSDAMTVILGVFTGFVLSVVMVLLFGALHRVNENMTRRNISSIRVQAAQAGGSGLVLDRGAYLPTHTNTRPVTGSNGISGRPEATMPVYVPHSGPVIDAEARELFQWRRYGYEVPQRERRYRRNPLGTAETGAYVETMTPARQMDTQSGVIVPAAQALFSGLVAALVAAVIAWRTGGDVVMWLVVGFVGGLAVAWVAALGLARSLVWKIERFTGQDLDGDGEQGEPESHTMIENPVKAREQVSQVIDDQARKASTAAMLAFWTKCVNVGTSTREHGARPGTKTLEDYEAARDLLIQLGLAQWRNPDNHRAGWDITTDLATGARIIGEHVRTMRTRHN